MRIKTSGKAHYIKVEPGESVVVEFCPDGYNATEHSHTVMFVVGTKLMPNGQMSLSLSLPKDKVYQIPGDKLILFLHDLPGYDKLAFKQGDDIDSIVELERYG